jgi:translation initiation factor 3 subunit B
MKKAFEFFAAFLVDRLPQSRPTKMRRGGPSKFSYANEDDVPDYLSDEENDPRLEDLIHPDDPTRQDEERKAVVIANLPIAAKDKVAKLKDRLLELVTQLDPLNPQDIVLHLPVDAETGSNLPFAFVAFGSEEVAKMAVETVNGSQMGTKNTLQVFPYTDLDYYFNMPSEYIPPALTEYTEGIDLSWLEDGREQFVMRFFDDSVGDETVVSWVDSIALDAEITMAYDGEREKKQGKKWCKMQVQWSPKGTFLITFHEQGLAIWGGPDFVRPSKGRFAHPLVTHALFSPCERFLVSWDGQASGSDEQSLIVWNVKTNEKLKAFSALDLDRQGAPPPTWPIIKWSFDGSMLARRVENGLAIYDTKTMTLLGGKSVVAKGIVDFTFSPADNLVAYWAPEADNAPARVVILDPITRRELRSANLFQVTSVSLQWQQPGGDFLCAIVQRHSKTKKSTLTNLEIFRIRDEGMPNETLTVQNLVTHVSFEPSPGVRLAVLIPSSKSAETRFDVSFYSLDQVRNGAKLEMLVVVENRSCAQVHWSPAGLGVCVLFGSGSMDFYDVEAKQTTATVEQHYFSEVSWDPSGRMLAGIVAQPMFGEVSTRAMQHNGFKIYSLQGVKLQERSVKKFFQFLWRPRPKTLLSDVEVEDLRKKLPSYARAYEREDMMIKKRHQAAENAERIKLLVEYRGLMAASRARYEALRERRERLGNWGRKEVENNDKEEVIAETIEELVSEKREVVGKGRVA